MEHSHGFTVLGAQMVDDPLWKRLHWFRRIVSLVDALNRIYYVTALLESFIYWRVSCVQNLNVKYMRRDRRNKSWVQNQWYLHHMFVSSTASCSQAHRPWRRYTCPAAFFTILLTSLTLKTEHCRCEFNGAKQNMAVDFARHGENLVSLYFLQYIWVTSNNKSKFLIVY